MEFGLKARITIIFSLRLPGGPGERRSLRFFRPTKGPTCRPTPSRTSLPFGKKRRNTSKQGRNGATAI
jgi:hypothetical protein